MSGFAAIADRAEQAAPEDQRELLERLWEALHGARPRRNRGGNNLENTFVSLLGLEAFENAAIMLLPFDRRFEREWYWRMGRGSVRPGWAHLNRLDANHCDRDDEATGWAATPALAMVVACARAHSMWIGR